MASGVIEIIAHVALLPLAEETLVFQGDTGVLFSVVPFLTETARMLVAGEKLVDAERELLTRVAAPRYVVREYVRTLHSQLRAELEAPTATTFADRPIVRALGRVHVDDQRIAKRAAELGYSAVEWGEDVLLICGGTKAARLELSDAWIALGYATVSDASLTFARLRDQTVDGNLGRISEIWFLAPDQAGVDGVRLARRSIGDAVAVHMQAVGSPQSRAAWFEIFQGAVKLSLSSPTYLVAVPRGEAALHAALTELEAASGRHHVA